MPVSASVSHDLSPCPPLQLIFEVFLGDPTPIPRSFSGTPTSCQRHRRMRVFFARAASPCFARQAWHLMCVCVCLSPPRRFQLCVGLFFFISTCLLLCCLWVCLNGYLQLDGPNLSYRHYLLVVFLLFVISFLYLFDSHHTYRKFSLLST